ncbi:uncharacterized protein QC761_110080 [Podospora bellae-mahoneyi]|uniref:Sialidase n=1 Tax=Podospora bellae-mahoneyi TaxID=2093777 RepID=A0ABR0FXI3_9PEZI|nr:hypothetical protein QC761_110080 [Podospora bellae-mahoneyi]
MASLGEVTFDFTFPCDPSTPPSFTFDPSLLEIPYNQGHARSSSLSSIYSFESTPSEPISAPSTRRTTPARSPIRTHGPLLLPKIRSQDQAIGPSAAAPAAKRQRTSPTPAAPNKSAYRPTHARSYTSPEAISFTSSVSFTDDSNPAPLLCSPVSFAHDSAANHSRRASSCSVENISFPSQVTSYRPMPTYVPARRTSTSPTPPPQPQPQTHLSQPEQYNLYQQYVPRAPSPLAAAAPIVPDMTPSTTLYSYLTSSNPAPSLVRSISFPLRDPNIKHFWWDVRQIRPWTNFTAQSLLSLPGAESCLSTPLSAALLPSISAGGQRHPETEAALHGIYAGYYLPKLNNALALSSTQPVQLSVPKKAAAGMNTECMFVGNVPGDEASAAAIFGGKPMARVVGIVKSFDRFNTGMRVEGNVKRVEYLRGLAHLHHAMREHGCRYGFILTEIELVVVRNGGERTPHFGFLEVTSVQLNKTDDLEGPVEAENAEMTACLALWGLCMLAGDGAMPGEAHWKSEIGAPAEGTRRKALERDGWMPQPQLAEKREAKRSRGWVWPEDAVGRKELGKRGVRYGGC